MAMCSVVQFLFAVEAEHFLHDDWQLLFIFSGQMDMAYFCNLFFDAHTVSTRLGFSLYIFINMFYACI